jgi:hypothetical protein
LPEAKRIAGRTGTKTGVPRVKQIALSCYWPGAV